MVKIPQNIKIQLRRQAYYDRALHYYITARHAFFCKFFPLSGNLTHHAIEMLLHSGLAKNYEYSELKDKYSKHDLVPMWVEFKGLYAQSKFSKYDKLVSKYNKWKDLRYPKHSKSDTVMFFDMKKGAESKLLGPKYRKASEYRLNLEELDEFFQEISLLTGINPDFVKTALFSEDAKKSYARDNVHKLWNEK